MVVSNNTTIQASQSITRVDPIYDYTKVNGGYFNVYYNADGYKEYPEPFVVSFMSLLDYNIRLNKDLFNYLKKFVKDGTTMSNVIDHLYDIGFPIDDWVKDYVDVLSKSPSDRLFNSLARLTNYLKNFGS